MVRLKRIHDHRETGPQLAEMGGKAFNLHFLQKNGISVPSWFCVSSSTHRDLLKPFRHRIDELMRRVSGSTASELESIASQISRLHQEIVFPKELSDELKRRCGELGENRFFAVRSSALAEDSDGFSFAGLFESYLYVKDREIESHIKKVWASAYTPRVLSYLSKRTLGQSEASIAVIIQVMVRSKSSGVVFSANPMGKLTEVVISAGYGLGEGIVANLADTDTYFYDRYSRQLRREVTKKKWQVAFDEAQGRGTKRAPVPLEAQNDSVLTEQQIEFLIDLTLKIEPLYGKEQDIEWAIDANGAIYITQARPITTIAPGPLYVYDNSNVAESYPGLVSRLTYTVVKRGYKENFSNTLARVGIPRRLIDSHPEIFGELVERIQGRVYYTLTNWHRMLMLLPGLNRLLIPMFDQMIGTQAASPQERRFSITKAVALTGFYLRFAAIFVSQFLRLKKSILGYEREFTRIYGRSRQRELKGVDPGTLFGYYSEFSSEIMRILCCVQANDVYLMIVFALTRKAVQSSGAEDSSGIFNGLFCGLEDMESVKPVRAMMSLAQKVRASPELQDHLRDCENSPDLKTMLLRCPGPIGREFARDFTAYLDEFGDRSLEELKLENPSFRENPKQLLRLIFNYASAESTSKDMISKEIKIRQNAEQKLKDRLRGRPVRRAWVFLLVKNTGQLLLNRERARMDRARIAGEARRYFNAIGAAYAERGAFSSYRDIYFLEEAELEALTRGRLDLSDAAALISKRKVEDKAFLAADPESKLYLKANGKGFVPQKESMKLGVGENEMRGVGCSPGIVRGEAAVIRDPNQALDIQGKILVTEMTDPGWVFLMISSKGLVAEKGSLLSHTAIIGRELGIPTVVGVVGATSKIPHGALIELDGSTGEVKIL